MAKTKSVSDSIKTSFGKRKRGSAKKLRNKRDKSEKNYRGQGR